MPNVVVSGMMGRMGSMIARDFVLADHVRLVGAVVAQDEVERARALLDQLGAQNVPVSYEVSQILKTAGNIDVYLDFSVWGAVEGNVPEVARANIPCIIGVSGFGEEDFEWLEKLSADNGIPILLVPNFSLGVLLLKHISCIVRKYFPKVELIETHHDMKRDAPSGTSLDIATSLAKIDPPAPPNPPIDELDMGSRGMSVRDVKIHSVRLPGVIAEQQVVFASKGELLTLTHNTTSRESFLTGIYYAIDHIHEVHGFQVGLDKIIII